MEFGKRLRAARIANKVTQQKMADTLGIQLRGYQKYESGHEEPSLNTLALIGEFLNVPIDWLLGRDEYLKSLGASFDAPKTDLPKHPRLKNRQ